MAPIGPLRLPECDVTAVTLGLKPRYKPATFQQHQACCCKHTLVLLRVTPSSMCDVDTLLRVMSNFSRAVRKFRSSEGRTRLRCAACAPASGEALDFRRRHQPASSSGPTLETSTRTRSSARNKFDLKLERWAQRRDTVDKCATSGETKYTKSSPQNRLLLY